MRAGSRGRFMRQATRHQVTDVDANRALERPARRPHPSLDPSSPRCRKQKFYAFSDTAYHPRRVTQSYGALTCSSQMPITPRAINPATSAVLDAIDARTWADARAAASS